MKLHSYIIPILGMGLMVNCGDDGTSSDTADASVQADAEVAPDAGPASSDSYVFESQFDPGVSPISKSGQAFRNVLVEEMKVFLAGLTAQVDSTPPSAGEIRSSLEFYFEFDSTVSGTVPLTFNTTPAPLQTTFDDVSTGKNLVGKVAGNDAATDHKVWTTPGNFIGWSETGGETPEALLRTWIQKIDDMAVARVSDPELDPDGAVISKVFLTSQGQDLQQLIQKFSLGAINISQGMDDYLDDDVDGKGLLSSNLQDGEKPFSKLGHAWDEGFGYFGAAIDYDQYTDEERASKGGRPEYQGYHDLDDDSKIDLVFEYNFYNSVNCGKRDFASDAGAKTTFGDDAFAAFRAGRELILSVDGELSDAQMTELRGYRDTARENWEKCIAATMVHYVNKIEGDMAAFGTDAYSFADHAKHWSELKGFSLGLQFNPASPLIEGTTFLEFQGILGIAPVLEDAEPAAIAQMIAGLGRLNMLLQTAYDFDSANIAGW